MIPKVIHYCWFGRNPLPRLAKKCIASWRKYLPDYEIKEWNEDNFDVNIIPYTREAYAAKKYAFVSDFARFRILNKYGGVYFDTDVEVLKPMDALIQSGAFMGMQNRLYNANDRIEINAGLGLAAEAGSPVLIAIIDDYNSRHFIPFERRTDGRLETVVTIVTDVLYRFGLQDINDRQQVGDFIIYPADYFGSRQSVAFDIPRTENTYTIHHFAATWMPWHSKIRKRLRDALPLSWSRAISRTKHRLLRKK